jgi:acetyl-CoA carboxylase biotin carboxyl carrier protein
LQKNNKEKYINFKELAMKIEVIKDLIKTIEKSNITEFDYTSEDGERIYLNKNTTVALSQPMVSQSQQPTSVETVAGQQTIEEESKEPALDMSKVMKSPIVGTFYGASMPGAKPFVSAGSKVKKGDVLCIIEAMKIMNQVTAENDGVIKQIFVEDGDPIEYGHILFEFE